MDHMINSVIGSGIGPGNGSYDDPNIQFDDDPIIGSYIDACDRSHDWCDIGFGVGPGNGLYVGSYDDPHISFDNHPFIGSYDWYDDMMIWWYDDMMIWWYGLKWIEMDWYDVGFDVVLIMDKWYIIITY